MIEGGTNNNDSVTISPAVFALLVAHAGAHPTTTVHGVLIGTRKLNRIDIIDASPICHENPTKPLVETALALVQSNLEGQKDKFIVGWYTAPELLHEKKPGPVALRIVASLAICEPVLLFLNNETIIDLLGKNECLVSNAILAYGKDFGMQWMKPLELKVLNESNAEKVIDAIFKDKMKINDLVDHWDEGTSSEWTSASNLSSYTKNHNS